MHNFPFNPAWCLWRYLWRGLYFSDSSITSGEWEAPVLKCSVGAKCRCSASSIWGAFPLVSVEGTQGIGFLGLKLALWVPSLVGLMPYTRIMILPWLSPGGLLSFQVLYFLILGTPTDQTVQNARAEPINLRFLKYLLSSKPSPLKGLMGHPCVAQKWDQIFATGSSLCGPSWFETRLSC